MTRESTDPWRRLPTLAVPNELKEHVRQKDRSSYILQHGFSKSELGTRWWNEQGISITLPSDMGGTPKLTRTDLFDMWRETKTDQDLLNFVWHVLAWGSGTSRRHNKTRIASCRTHVGTLREAIDSARNGNRRDAYSQLVRPGRATIRGLGPAFFTKILYFATERVDKRCLILDARVAGSLHRLGWSISPRYSENTTQFSYNWFTDTYVSYCTLLDRWAAEAGPGVSSDMLERALFDGLPASRGS